MGFPRETTSSKLMKSATSGGCDRRSVWYFPPGKLDKGRFISIGATHRAEMTRSVGDPYSADSVFSNPEMRWHNSCGPHDTQPQNDSTDAFKVLPIVMSRVLVVFIGASSFMQTCWGLSCCAGERREIQ